MAIEIFVPIIKESKIKQPEIANQGFLYSQLADHRRFEELIYSVYKNEIEQGSWQNRYDAIYLMQGVREKGRDCVLYKSKKSIGVIQCKHSKVNKRVDKSECCKEIIKFVLYSLTDEKLIYDIETFTYWLVSSSGFSDRAKTMIDDFNTLILKEPNLASWIKNIIKSNAGLASLSYENDKDKIECLLSKLTIKSILPQDIDLLLAKEYNYSIQSLFFEFKTVTDNTDIKKLRKDVLKQNEYQPDSKLPLKEILKRLKVASFFLAEYNNSIENLPNAHIDRKETDDLLKWIKTPLSTDDSPICVLAGNAGYGKSVVLKDLYDKLLEDSIPVLGLKADKLYASDSTDLEKNKIQFEDGIEKVVNSLLQSFDKVVVVVDQLDALSQSLSSKREYLDTYNFFIQKLIHIAGVRVVASIRLYDLNFDTAFTYYKKQKQIELGELSDIQVKSILSKLNLEITGLPNRLLNLLKIPNNLNVFCQVFNKDIGLFSINSLYDLYYLFWKQKLIQKPKESGISSEICIEVTYAIASKMFEKQRISVDAKEIIDHNFDEIEFLKSNNVIVEKKREVQFFHQSFYDFVFAKMFVDQNRNMLDYVIKNNQSLFIRSSLVMVMSYLRQNNKDEYLKNLKAIITQNRFKFHLKLLLINTLAFEPNPTPEEKSFVENNILKKDFLRRIFLESVFSKEWLGFLYKRDYLNNLLCLTQNSTWFTKELFRNRFSATDLERNKELIFRICIRQLPKERSTVLEILKELPEFDGKGEFVLRVLRYLKIWDSQIAKELFKQYLDKSKKSRYDYYKILEDVAVYDLDWVFGIYKPKLLAEIKAIEGTNNDLKFDYEDVDLLKKAFQIDSTKSICFYFDIILKLIKITSLAEDEKSFYRDTAFSSHFYNRHNHNNLYNYEAILNLVTKELKEQSKRNTRFFRSFVRKNKNNNSQTVNALLLQAYLSDPKDNVLEIFEFLEKYFNDKNLDYHRNIDYYARKLINCSYGLFNAKQKLLIKTKILSLQPKWENQVYDDHNNKRCYQKSFGYTQYKYLRSIPTKERDSDQILKKRFQELERKGFGKGFSDDDPNAPLTAGLVPAPLSQNAYANMDFKDWETTFFQYKSDLIDSKNGKMVSMLEHSRAFESRVSSEPDHFYSFIKKLITEAHVPQSYILKGLEGLKKGEIDPNKLLDLVLKTTKLELDREHALYLIWVTDYLIKKQAVNNELISYLIKQALYHPDPNENDGGIQKGINSVRGAAIDRLFQAIDIKEYRNDIIKTISLAVVDKCASVRATIMKDLAYLLNYDKPKTLEYFLELINRNEVEVYEVSLWSVQHISHYYFTDLIPFFEKAIKIEKIQDDISVILTVRWLEGKDGCFSLLKSVWKNSDKAKGRMIEVALANYKDQDKEIRRKCKYLFNRFLKEESQDVIHAYSVEFLRLKPERFNELFPLLKNYAKSKVARKSPHDFYKYLKDSAKLEPLKVLSLLKLHKSYKRDNEADMYVGDDAIKALLNIYNTLRTDDKGYSKAIRKCLVLFDLMLMNPSMRREANLVLENVDS